MTMHSETTAPRPERRSDNRTGFGDTRSGQAGRPAGASRSGLRTGRTNTTEATKTVDRRRLLGKETRSRILEVAERLFTTHGYDGISMRGITAEAGVNIAAIHYHFGSKEELLFEILRCRAQPLADQRMKLLDELRRNPPVELEKVITAFLIPAFFEEKRGRLGRSPFAELRARLTFENEGLVRSILAEILNQSSLAYVDALAECCPHLPRAEVFFRFHFLIGAMFYTMSNTGRVRALSGGLIDPSDPDKALAHLVPFIAAGFRAPALRGRAMAAARRPGGRGAAKATRKK